MATSRTGTAAYLRARRRVIAEARRAGLTECPGYELPGGEWRGCGRVLDYTTPLTSASAETDHILEHRYGGSDDHTNLRVLCRTCNLERNRVRVPVQAAALSAFPTSREW